MTGIVVDDIDAVALIDGHQWLQVAAEPWPSRLQRQLSCRARLQVQVVGSRGPASWSVVEHCDFGICLEQLMYLRIVVGYLLRLVPSRGYSKMRVEYGEWIHEDIQFCVEGLDDLFLWPVFRTEETRALADILFRHFRPRGDDASGIPLCHERDGVVVVLQLPCLHGIQVAVALLGIRPQFKLSVEEPHERIVLHIVSLSAGHALACGYLKGAQLVLVGVVGIHSLYGESGVAISSPPAAEVQFVVDTSDAVSAAESQSHGIVFAITGIGQENLS